MLNSCCSPVVIEAIEELRNRPSRYLTASQLADVVTRLETNPNPQDLAEEFGVDTQDLVDMVTELGVALSHQHGAADPTQPVVESGGQLSLFGNPGLVIPKSFKLRRNEPALRSVMHHRPDEQVCERFVERYWQPDPKLLSFEVLAVVAFFARIGRLQDIGSVNEMSASFADLVVRAYDTLDIGRVDAMRGLVRVLSTDDTREMQHQLVLARVLFDPELSRLGRLLARLPNPNVEQLLETEQQKLRDRVRRSPGHWEVSDIGMLTPAQVRRIAVASGLPTDGVEESTLEQLRRRLSDLDQVGDMDILLPAALAAEANNNDAFWERVS